MSAVRYPKPEVLARLPKGAHAVIEASAGTGKTFTLEHLVVDLLLERDVPLERILVVTFTEKATFELRARLRQKLASLLAYEGATDEGAEGGWLLNDASRAVLERSLASFDSASISTIHGFCQRILAENAFASGRLFDEQQVEGREVFATAFREALRNDLACNEEDRHWLRAALEGGIGVARLERLLFDAMRERGEIRPVLDAGAARDALDAFPRDEGLIPLAEAELKKANLHANTRRALLGHLTKLQECVRAFGDDLPRMLVGYDALAKARSIEYLQRQAAYGRVGPATQALIKGFEGLDAVLVPPEAALVQRFLPRVRERVERRKREEGLFDFDDMLTLVDEALSGPGGTELARSLRERYQVALIDEFQDTDDVQWRIFRTLFLTPGHTLFLVGDPKQAIYAFRGADVHTYLRAKETVLASGGVAVPLESNYRSTSSLIDAYNAILDATGDPPFFDGAIRYDVPVRCGDPSLVFLDGEGREAAPVHLLRFPADPRFRLRRREVIELLGNVMAREIRVLLDPSSPFRFGPRRAPRPLRASDIYILTRTFKEGLDLADVLRREGIPHTFFKQGGLFQTDEARHVRDVLAALAEPWDTSKRLKAWLTPFFGVPLDALARTADLPAEHPIVAHLTSWAALAEAGSFDRLFARIVEDSGIVRRQILLADGERALTNYLHLFELLLEHAAATHATIGELVADLDAFIAERRAPPGEHGNVQRVEGDGDAVQIMTKHLSKGLEAAVVFVAGGLTRPLFDPEIFHDGAKRVRWVGRQPEAIKRRTEEEARREDQRLLYVALTRAKGRLYLPLFEGEGRTAFVPEGSYAPLNARLRAMDAAGALKPPLFSSEEVRLAEHDAPVDPDRLAIVSPWSPPPSLLEDRDPTPELEALRERRRGPIFTSYTQMRGHGGFDRIADAGFTPRSGGRDDLDEYVASTPASDEDLPGGVATGLFLHALLEQVDLGAVRDAASLDAWCSRPEVVRLADALASQYDVEPEHVPRALERVHTALTTPLVLAGRTVRGGLAAAGKVLREMEFVYPIGERGFLKGYIDVLFEDEELTYVLDWKSDRLASFDPVSMREHVDAAYGLQVRIYALAALKLLGVRSEEEYERRFGGIVYAFVRAMGGDPGAGIDLRRPAWSELVAWESELASRGTP